MTRRILPVLLLAAVALLFLAAPAPSAPAGQMTWAVHFTLAPRWLDPGETKSVTFKVGARDEREAIGGGTHSRVVVNVARFDERVQRKL